MHIDINLKADTPCNFKLWLMYYYHYLTITAKRNCPKRLNVVYIFTMYTHRVGLAQSVACPPLAR